MRSDVKPDVHRITALDGWRGIAILLVLFDHFQIELLGKRQFATGMIGVLLFFVLSGYLITGKLAPGVSLKRFYLRRFFRLMPAAWIYLFCIAVFGVLDLRFAFGCLLFFRNMQPLGVPYEWYTLHFWSLSIEEQFYLVWPALLLMSGRFAKLIALTTGLASLAWCMLFHAPIFSTVSNAPALVLGCLLALVGWKIPARVAVVLSMPGLPWIGRISYSLYIWNPLCFFLCRAFPFGFISFLIPVASYYLIENPCIEWGRRLLEQTHTETAVSLAVP